MLSQTEALRAVGGAFLNGNCRLAIIHFISNKYLLYFQVLMLLLKPAQFPVLLL